MPGVVLVGSEHDGQGEDLGSTVATHQAVLIAQEARAAGVNVTEFPFTTASVGRIALSLHQAIRNHRIALPDDEVLLDELISVRLRKNTLGIYRLDHDAGPAR